MDMLSCHLHEMKRTEIMHGLHMHNAVHPGVYSDIFQLNIFHLHRHWPGFDVILHYLDFEHFYEL